MSVVYLTATDILALNLDIIQRYSPGEMPGALNPSLLQSAVHRPQQSVLGQDAYPTIPEKAAVLLESLAKNHSLHNANKRTAFAAMVLFLYVNGYGFGMDQKEAEDFTVDVVNHVYSVQAIASIISTHMYPLSL